MDTALITGGSGFLGGYLIKAIQTEFHIVSTYNKNYPTYSVANWERLNLINFKEVEQLIMKIHPRIVIHNAAISDVDVCEKNCSQAEIVNIQATEIISRINQKIGARIFYISTDQVFAGTSAPYFESDPPNPINYYGWTKWLGELSVAENKHNYVIIRAPLMFGPLFNLGNSFSERLRKLWESGKTTKLSTDQFSTPIYAGNLAEAVLELTKTDFTGIIHLAGSERISRFQLGLLLAKQFRINNKLIQPVKISEVKSIGIRPVDVSLKIDLAQNLLKTEFLNCWEGIQNAYPQN